jgi:hypothetical protein
MKRCPDCDAINLDSSLKCVRCRVELSGKNETTNQLDSGSGSGMTNGGDSESGAGISASLAPESLARESFARVAAKDFQVEVQFLPKVSFALVYADVAVVSSIRITNHSKEPAKDVVIKVMLSPQYSDWFTRLVPEIRSGQTLELVGHEIVLPLLKDRFREIRECEKAALKVEIFEDQETRYANTWPVEILPYNEWIMGQGTFHLLAQHVRPGQDAVKTILSRMKDPSLCGYQAGSGRVEEMVQGLYYALQGLEITYINPPPSFDGQRIRDPDEVLKHGRGTCLDLALLIASCLEQIGLHPLIPLFQGHAVAGVWLKEVAFDRAWMPAEGPDGQLRSGSPELMLFNSTTFALRPKVDFEQSTREMEQCFSSMPFLGVVDVRRAREERILPLP